MNGEDKNVTHIPRGDGAVGQQTPKIRQRYWQVTGLALAREARKDETSSWSIQMGKEDIVIRCHHRDKGFATVICG